MKKKVSIVTGASGGIGKATAEALAEMGAAVVMVCRDRVRGEEALAEIKKKTGSDSVELMIADLSSQKSIRKLADDFKAKHKKLHVLINNAGILARRKNASEDGVEMTFAVNHLAYFLLTNLLLDQIKASAPARIVNVSSDAHYRAGIDFDNLQGEKSYSSINAYGQSKLCNVLFTNELARRLKGSNVTANSLHPGVVGTGVFREMPFFIGILAKLFAASPRKGAETSIHLAASPKAEGITGKYFKNCKQVWPSRIAQDESTARRLWEISEKLTSL